MTTNTTVIDLVDKMSHIIDKFMEKGLVSMLNREHHIVRKDKLFDLYGDVC